MKDSGVKANQMEKAWPGGPMAGSSMAHSSMGCHMGETYAHLESWSMSRRREIYQASISQALASQKIVGMAAHMK